MTEMRNDSIADGANENYRDAEKPIVSSAVIRRLPRYFRYLRALIRQGKHRISSAELSRIMNVTASQIRQDLNCFGGFGQQGYGYNVNYLYAKICELLGVGNGFHAIVIGAGNLGRALVKNPMFEKRGVDVIGMFDIAPDTVGHSVGDVRIMHIDTLGDFCRRNKVDIAVLTLPKEHADGVVEKIVEYGIPGIWNFTGKEFKIDNGRTVVEEIHLGDSLMTLCYEISRRNEEPASENIESYDDFDGE